MIKSEMTGIYGWINLAEAALWWVLALAVILSALRGKNARLKPVSSLILAVTLVAFGISDLVETQTGAWWRPWWLLAWKGACVAVIGCFAVVILRRRQLGEVPDRHRE